MYRNSHNVPYFINGIRCPFHDHGASCAVDALMKLFYQSIFKFDELEVLRDGGPFVKLLKHMSHQREIAPAQCLMREPVWNWLEQKLGEAYGNRGEGKDEIFSGVQAMVNDCPTAFSTKFSCDITCGNCSSHSKFSSVADVLSITCHEPFGGNLQMHIERQLGYLPKRASKLCNLCGSKCQPSNGVYELPHFLVIEFGLDAAKNKYKVSFCIKEEMEVLGFSYILTGAIVMRPEHFYCICRHSLVGGFVNVDSLPRPCDWPYPIIYNSFTGAVQKLGLDVHEHVTSPESPGVQFVVFKKVEFFHGSSSNKTVRDGVNISGMQDQCLQETTHIRYPRAETVCDSTNSKDHCPAEPNETKFQNRSSGNSEIPLTGCSMHSFDDIPSFIDNEVIVNRDKLGSKNKDVLANDNLMKREIRNKGDEIESINEAVQCPIPQRAQNVANIDICDTIPHTGCSTQDIPDNDSLTKSEIREKGYENENINEYVECTISQSAQNMANNIDVCDTIPHTGYRMCNTHTNGIISKNEVTDNLERISSDNETVLLQTPQSAPNVKYSAEFGRAYIKVFGKEIPALIDGDVVFVQSKDIFESAGLTKHIAKEGYTVIDKRLMKRGFASQQAFKFYKRFRTHVRLDAVMALLEDNGAWMKSNWNQLKQEISSILHSKLASNLKQSISGTCQDHEFIQNGQRQNKERKSYKLVLTEILRKYFAENCQGDKKKYTSAIASIIKPDLDDEISRNSHVLNKGDMMSVLSSVAVSQKGKTKRKIFLQEFLDVTQISTEESIHIQENFAGTRLIEKLRKKIPHQMPTYREGKQRKRQYWDELNAILLPSQTDLGWRIDPHRLYEILSFLYYWMGTDVERHWRIYGDGREIGGRSSTFLSISLISNEAILFGHQFQSPKNIFPLAIFYEGDNRDNLEQNLGFPNSWLNTFVQSKSKEGDTFYLTGDEMFLEAMVDGHGILGPTTVSGWNIYKEMSKDHKGETAPSGKRLDMHLCIDR